MVKILLKNQPFKWTSSLPATSQICSTRCKHTTTLSAPRPAHCREKCFEGSKWRSNPRLQCGSLSGLMADGAINREAGPLPLQPSQSVMVALAHRSSSAASQFSPQPEIASVKRTRFCAWHPSGRMRFKGGLPWHDRKFSRLNYRKCGKANTSRQVAAAYWHVCWAVWTMHIPI